MFDRLNIFAVLRGHWKGLRNRSGSKVIAADLVARGFLVGSTVFVVVLSWRSGLELKQPGTLFAGLSLLSSGLLAAFAQIASIRTRFSVPDDPDFDTEIDTRNMLDEAVAHVLTAALLAAVAAALLLVAINVGGVETSQAAPVGTSGSAPVGPATVSTATTSAEQSINTAFSTLIAGLATYLFVLFVMTIRKLYAAYVVGNNVSEELSGHHVG